MEAFTFPTLEAPAGLATHAQPEPEAPQIDLQAEAEAARAAGHEAGFQAGLVEAQAHMAAGIAALQAAAEAVAAERDRVAAAVEAAAVELGRMEHCDVQAERRVARGGAIVRTLEGEVDATLATKLSRAREALEAELRGGDAPAPPAAGPVHA